MKVAGGVGGLYIYDGGWGRHGNRCQFTALHCLILLHQPERQAIPSFSKIRNILYIDLIVFFSTYELIGHNETNYPLFKVLV